MINKYAVVSKLEVGSFIVILLAGVLFGYFVYDTSRFIGESDSLYLVKEQQNIAEVITSLDAVHKVFVFESGFEQAANRKNIRESVSIANSEIEKLKIANKNSHKQNLQLFLMVDPVIRDLRQLLNTDSEQNPPNSQLLYGLSTQRLNSTLKELRNRQSQVNRDQFGIISEYHKQLERFRGSILTLILGTISLVTLVISLNMKQRHSQSKLASGRKLISDAVNSLDEGVVLTNESDDCLVINETLNKLSPELNDQLKIGRSFEEAFAATINRGHLQLVEDQTHLLIENSAIADSTDNKATPKEYLSQSGKYMRVTKRNRKGAGKIITFSDITYLKLAQKQLQHQATMDGLTGLSNRNHFLSKLQDALSRSKRYGHKVALMVFDLDKFKQVNDTLGHAVGDELLISVAKRITSNLREIDVSARMGGDEFAAYLDQIKDIREVRITADRIITELHQQLKIEGVDIEVSSSIGVALFPDNADELSTLLKHADAACYHAKQMGRNNYQVYNRDMKVRAMQQMTMEARLRGALDEDSLLLNYQPQLELSSQRIIGMEAFLRWNDAKLGQVSPDEFIPLAEKTGLIAEMGEWVIRQACSQIRKWIDKNHAPVQVAINISHKQFRLHNLPVIIDKALNDFSISPKMLALEITEAVIMSDIHAAVETLNILGDRGLTLVIDDFGTGSSSLYRLQQLPIHALKIDQSFIKDIIKNKGARDITAAIIAIAQKLHLRTIAEGVETDAQAKILKDLGCDIIQGYLVDRPMCAADFEKAFTQNLISLGTG